MNILQLIPADNLYYYDAIQQWIPIEPKNLDKMIQRLLDNDFPHDIINEVIADILLDKYLELALNEVDKGRLRITYINNELKFEPV